MLNIQATALPYDELYEALIQAHEGLSIEQSHALIRGDYWERPHYTNLLMAHALTRNIEPVTQCVTIENELLYAHHLSFAGDCAIVDSPFESTGMEGDSRSTAPSICA